ncbi:MAG TPA: SRPBCC domain-containing protein [Flavobacterium sp.]|nr:SRPBCC domain-containing protein [Flavobacterium sp.]
MMENLINEKKKTISINRTFNLPLTTVWKAWTEPESLKKWFSPEGYTTPSSTVDFTIGGKYLNSMKSPDGKETWSTGTYKEIIPFKKIVYSDSFADPEGNIVPASYYKMPGEWDLQLIVTVEFEEIDGKTNMKLQHADLPVEMADDCIKGWNSCFDKLEKNLK